jgi:hypothetical protein
LILKKLKVIKITRQKKLDTTKDKNNLIDLFNEQLKILDTLKNHFKNCQTLALNLDEAYKLAKTIWRIPEQDEANYPILKTTKHFEDFLEFRTKYINKATETLTLSESLDKLIKEYPKEIILQLYRDLNIHIRSIQRENPYADIEHLFLGTQNTELKLKHSNKLLKNFSKKQDLEILYPTFLDDFEKTSETLNFQIICSTEQLNNYVEISKQICKIYQQYHVLQ